MATPPPQSTDKLTTCLHALQMSMLSVGSGDGSQQEAIVKRGLTKVQVTFYDTKTELLRKYPHAAATLQYLQQTCEEPPRYQVDATALDKIYPASSFDLIFFTFPHTGIPNSDRRCVESNQKMLRGFLQSASKLVKPDGEVQITLKNGEHYERWKLPELLDKEAGLTLEASHPLDKSMFPGYKHRLTLGSTGGRLKEVPDKKGAQVHVFSPNGGSSLKTNSNPAMFSGKLLTIVEAPEPKTKTWTDEYLWSQVILVLESLCAPADVLDIRRQLQPIPDTRQLNRILYAMEKAEVVTRHAPGSTNRKPQWTLT
jgi:hypothetical protein